MGIKLISRKKWEMAGEKNFGEITNYANWKTDIKSSSSNE